MRLKSRNQGHNAKFDPTSRYLLISNSFPKHPYRFPLESVSTDVDELLWFQEGPYALRVSSDVVD